MNGCGVRKVVILMHVRVCVRASISTYTGTSGGQKPTVAVDHQGNCIPSFFLKFVFYLFIS